MSPPGPAVFTLLVPSAPRGLHRVVNPEDTDRAEAGAMLELALPLLEEASGSHIDGVIGDHNPFDAVSDVVNCPGRRRDHHLDAAGARLALAAQ